jgi:hypothetical protein
MATSNICGAAATDASGVTASIKAPTRFHVNIGRADGMSARYNQGATTFHKRIAAALDCFVHVPINVKIYVADDVYMNIPRVSEKHLIGFHVNDHKHTVGHDFTATVRVVVFELINKGGFAGTRPFPLR